MRAWSGAMVLSFDSATVCFEGATIKGGAALRGVELAF